MRKTLLIVLALVLLAAGTALAFGLPGGLGGGPSAKKNTLTLGQANAGLKPYEGSALAPAAVEYITIGDADFDDFSLRLAKMQIISGFAARVVDDANAKLDAAQTKEELTKLQENITVATNALQPLVAEGAALIAKAPQLLTNLKSKLTSNPMLLADVTKVLDVDKIKAIAEHISKLVTDLTALAGKIKDKLAALPVP